MLSLFFSLAAIWTLFWLAMLLLDWGKFQPKTNKKALCNVCSGSHEASTHSNSQLNDSPDREINKSSSASEDPVSKVSGQNSNDKDSTTKMSSRQPTVTKEINDNGNESLSKVPPITSIEKRADDNAKEGNTTSVTDINTKRKSVENSTASLDGSVDIKASQKAALLKTSQQSNDVSTQASNSNSQAKQANESGKLAADAKTPVAHVAEDKNDQANVGALFVAPDQKDDLKVIKGIGVVMEKTLNDLGITTFSQLAGFKQADIKKVSDALDASNSGFGDRITRDEWVTQAQALAK